MDKLILSLILLFGFGGLSEVAAQKKISGRSVPIQFSMIESSVRQNVQESSLKSNYVSSLQVTDLDSLPDEVAVRPYSVAVIMGVEQYDFIPFAPYAAHDAELVSRYFKALLGVDRVIVHKNKEVSGFFFENLFNAEEGELSRIIEKGKTDLFVYYSGHGVSAADGKDVYMLPADSKLRLIEKQGYSLNSLFEQLDKLPTKSTTVFIDACFSGLGKFSQTGSPLNLMQTEGVKVKPLLFQPWLRNPNFRVFTSSATNQASLVLDEARTGLFTYFLAMGLRGRADINQDGHVTADELYRYIYSNVSENSKKIYQEQTPCFYGDGSFVLY
ncbi:MAG: caspase family protein [Parabacteroides sp.]|nr:caspase family protein [Parabacteroides sp.]